MKKLIIIFLFIFICQDSIANDVTNSEPPKVESTHEIERVDSQEKLRSLLERKYPRLAHSQRHSPNLAPRNDSNPDNEFWVIPQNGVEGDILKMVAHNDDIFVGGFGFRTTDLEEFNFIMRYNTLTDSWHPVGNGLDQMVVDLAIAGDYLYVLGNFDSVEDIPGTRKLVRYHINNGTWHSVGGSLDEEGFVYRMKISGDNLFLSGWFESVGGVEGLNNIARYSISEDTWYPLGLGLNDVSNDIEVIGDNVFVVGDFTSAGGDGKISGIARYNLVSDSWSPLNIGNFPQGVVLQAVETDLYVGGWFESVNGMDGTKGIVRYNTIDGSWNSVAGGLDEQVLAMALSGNNLYVGGYFLSAGDLTGVNRIARFDIQEQTWNAMGDGVTSSEDSYVTTITVLGYTVYVGGRFEAAGGKSLDLGEFNQIEPLNFAMWLDPELFTPETFTAEISGPNAGWRILGSPVRDATYGDLLSGIWTQGYDGASVSNGAPNVFWYDETTRSFVAPNNATNRVGTSSNDPFANEGRAILVYVYEDDGTSTEWPKSLSITGIQHFGIREVSYSNTEISGDSGNGWHLASNPFPVPIRWSNLVAAGGLQDMISVVFFFDANANDGAGGYRLHYGFDIPNLPGSIAHDGVIAPFQGFWVRTSGTSAQGRITFRESYQTTGGTLFTAPEHPSFLAFSVDGESLEASALLLINEGDALSTGKPIPFTAEMIRFGFMNEDGIQPDIFRSTEAQAGDKLILPVDFASVHSGTYTLNIKGSVLSEIESTIILFDHFTGAEHPLSPDNPYTFTYDAQQQPASIKDGFNPVTSLKDSKSLLLASEQRFELHIHFGNTTSTEPVLELPAAFGLSQNYPNPFNPTTNISFSLPESGAVRLEVYNVMGQKVATLLNGHQNAGTHTVSFDATNLASGVYIYRLTAGSFAQTRKMLLVK